MKQGGHKATKSLIVAEFALLQWAIKLKQIELTRS